MSGAEVLGLISGIITVIEASIKLYNALEDSSGLPPSLRDVASRLPLIQDSLMIATHGIKQDCRQPESYASLEAVLQACSDRVTQLHQIFEAIIPPAGAKRTPRYLKALRSIPRVEKANRLMEGIVGDLQVLTLNHAVKAATREQIKNLAPDIQTRRAVEIESPVTLYNTGQGRHFVHTGRGNQNVASNTATQINGTFSGGTFNFTQRY
ncbi:hypothetical protein NM208_g5218 [Fusarium decemcellulare]|uniref:Uncharacterized protein n=1 Tax=Fusarium decemcellulare TaxID=57161 RepID=A0ACC1SHX1_9HYPO|nr:hypothetical protein NM208_g5218 [Fusarium decemcellulare]